MSLKEDGICFLKYFLPICQLTFSSCAGEMLYLLHVHKINVGNPITKLAPQKTIIPFQDMLDRTMKRVLMELVELLKYKDFKLECL
jgi:hypothetical protein